MKDGPDQRGADADQDRDAIAAVEAQAVAYCEALHHARTDVLETLCDDGFAMRTVSPEGGPVRWTKETFLARVGGRDGFAGTPSYRILRTDVTGEIAHVHLTVDVPPRRFEDVLGFFKVGGEWRLATKLFRTAEGPPLEG